MYELLKKIVPLTIVITFVCLILGEVSAHDVANATRNVNERPFLA